MASVEAADSFAQNRPSGAEIGGDEGGQRRGVRAVVRLSVQKASFHARMMLSSMVEAMPGTAIGVST